MGKFLNEFKQFAMRGNVLDMAVGVIIGGAFGKIDGILVLHEFGLLHETLVLIIEDI